MDQTSRLPNILFFFADDQRNDTLSCAGHAIVETPTIDRLAANGVRFENMFVTRSTCWASRTTILTGLTSRSSVEPNQSDRVRPEALTELFPDLLRDAGYRTGLFGKWHAKMPKGFKPQDHFDEFEKIFRNPYFKTMPNGSKRHTTELIGDRGIAFLKSHRGKESPFCLNLWFNAGHAEDRDREPGAGHYPWPKAMDGKYDDLKIPAPRLSDPAIFEAHPEFFKISNHRERFHWRWDTPEKYQLNIRAYFRMLSGVDHVMARVLQTLKEEGLAENTIVVYVADNGYYMGDRGFAGKCSHHEQSQRVPLVIFDPRQPKQHRGRTVDTMAAQPRSTSHLSGLGPGAGSGQLPGRQFETYDRRQSHPRNMARRLFLRTLQSTLRNVLGRRAGAAFQIRVLLGPEPGLRVSPRSQR